MVNLLAFVPIVAIIAVIALIVIVFKSCYKKAPPNKAMVITGPSGSKTVHGKACFVIPLIQRVDYMSLENIQVDFTSRDEIPTKDAININVDAVANMAIDTEPERMAVAASKFLGYSIADIQTIVQPILEGNIREIISQTTLKELIQGDKKQFAEKVMENVAPNLADLGLKLTTFNIQNFKDRNGVIENLGIENTVQISKDAKKAQAQAKAEIAIAEAESARAANEAQVVADAEIAQKQNELAIKKAQLKKVTEVEQARADAARGIEAEEQRKAQEIATANANLARQEKEIELKEREVAIKEKSLEAEVKKTAEAKRYADQQAADAHLYTVQRQSEASLFDRQKKAEAEKVEATQRAEAEKITSEAKRIAAENEAAGIKAKGVAEAEAIRAKALAEAEGTLKKAEAMREYGDAATMDMKLAVAKAYIDKLPEIAAAVAAPMANIGNITMYGEGNTAKLTGDVTKTMKQITDGFTDATGFNPMMLLSGVLGGKLAASNSGSTVNVHVDGESQ
jgi:flotillin